MNKKEQFQEIYKKYIQINNEYIKLKQSYKKLKQRYEDISDELLMYYIKYGKEENKCKKR